MRMYTGRVSELRLDAGGQATAWIECPVQAAPAAGQYLLGLDPAGSEPLATALFSGGTGINGFLAAPPVPPAWQPGTRLELRGPLGHGFHLPAGARRVALACLGGSPARLLPLVELALAGDMAVTFAAESAPNRLPPQVEVVPLDDVPGVLAWADYLALDVPLAELGSVHSRLGVPPGGIIPCPGQALVLANMPCAGAGACGVCAVPVRRAWKLACSDGPVFDLNELDFI